MSTIADAHRNYALGKVLAEVGRGLAVLSELDTSDHDEAIASCAAHILELVAIEAPPADLQDFIDVNMQSSRDGAEAQQALWTAIENDSPSVKYTHPSEYQQAERTTGLAEANRKLSSYLVAAIDSAWTPGGGN